MIQRAKELNFKYLAITEHGRLGSAPSAAATALEPDSKGRTLESIVGCEIYICNGNMHVKESTDREINGVTKRSRPRHAHACLLCIDEVGYANLVEMSNIGSIEGYYYEPRVDLDTIAAHSKGLVATSGCMSGMIPQAILKEDYNRVDELVGWWHDVFGENFYLEVQYHGIEAQMKIFNHIMKLSKRHGLPVIASNDVHYLYPGDKKAHDLLKSMRMRNTENSGQGYATGEFYLKSAEEMYDVFEEVPEGCMPPEYEITCHNDALGTRFSAEPANRLL